MTGTTGRESDAPRHNVTPLSKKYQVHDFINDVLYEIIRVTEESDRLNTVRCVSNDYHYPRGFKHSLKTVKT